MSNRKFIIKTIYGYIKTGASDCNSYGEMTNRYFSFTKDINLARKYHKLHIAKGDAGNFKPSIIYDLDYTVVCKLNKLTKYQKNKL